MQSISLDAAEAMTGISRRTLWRRVADGELTSTGKDARNRAVLALEGLQGWMQGHTGLVFSAQDLHRLCQADAGDAQAQVGWGGTAKGVPREGGCAFFPGVEKLAWGLLIELRVHFLLSIRSLL